MFLCGGASAGQPLSAAEKSAAPKKQPVAGGSNVVAHRGLMRHAPENTLPAFRACLELGFGFELDVRRTSDGTLVCVHDDTLDRTTSGTGPVTGQTLADMQQLDAGSWFDRRSAGERVPTIEQIFALTAGYAAAGRMDHVVIAIDIKANDAEVERDLVQLARRHKISPWLVYIGRTITDPQVRQRLKQADESAQVALLCGSPAEVRTALTDPAVDWVYLRFLPEAGLMQEVHAAGRKAFIAGATVAGERTQNWQTAMDVKIDAVLTDFPLVFRRQQRHSAQTTE
ncbi:MAG: hypothetical protein KDA79_13265 [Planctomycetaceae bacterium]|nr:hypothetical protein [Planctomycetaceae bacterium]